MKFIILFILCLLTQVVYAQTARTYYVSVNGNDKNNGITPATAFKTLEKINAMQLQPGDKILLQGGDIFKGTIYLDSLDKGSVSQPIIISSYGKGKAIINAADSNGLVGFNTSFIKIIGLHFKGSGVNNNKGNGIHFYSDKLTAQCNSIEIKDCIAEGFFKYGILISCAEGEEIKGYNNVRITSCIATANGEGGIGSYGGQTLFHHTNFYIAQCKAFLNKGIVTKTENHSGNGIVMGGVENIVIEHCKAYENGADNRCTAGGPVGIWIWLCKNGIIQYCESHHNHAGLTKDGGGFDIDGGSANCIMQYNYSHNNEGAGYLLAEYGAELPFTNNIIRFNISENDGRKNNYGSIGIWGVTGDHAVTNCFIYNNTFIVNDRAVVNGTPAAIFLLDDHFSKVIVANNIFITSSKTSFINSNATFDTSAIFFLSNNYYNHSGEYHLSISDSTVTTLNAWLAKDTLQEKLNGNRTALTVNPNFENKTYVSHQPALFAGADLNKLYALNTGAHDFYYHPLQKKKPFIGAAVK